MTSPAGPSSPRGWRAGAFRLLLAAASVLAACDRSFAAGPDTVRIATEGAYPPFNYAENNEPAGFEVDLGRALCAAMATPCTFVLQDWDGMIAGLKARTYDAIMSSMEITPERRRRIAFTRRYYRIPAALIGPKAGAEPSRNPDLAGRTVGVIEDSEFAAYLQSEQKGAIARPYGKLEDADLDLLIGRLDFVLGDKLALSRFLASREGACCRFVGDLPVDRGEGIGIGLRREDGALRARFDAAIAAVMADGTYDRIRAKYFPFDIR